MDILPAKKENIDIFSVINVPGKERTIDVRYTAHGSPVYPASQMNAAALANMDRVRYDYFREPCADWSEWITNHLLNQSEKT